MITTIKKHAMHMLQVSFFVMILILIPTLLYSQNFEKMG